MRCSGRRAAAHGELVGGGLMELHEAIKRQRTADALRYFGARASTVGRRVVPSGKQAPLGRAFDRPWERPARDVLREERRVFVPVAVHWSEVDA